MAREIKLLSPNNITQGFKVTDPEDVMDELDTMMKSREGGAFLGLEKDAEDYNKESFGGVIAIVPVNEEGEQSWVVDNPEIDAYAEVTRAQVEEVIKRWFADEPLNLPFQKYNLMMSRPNDMKPSWARF